MPKAECDLNCPKCHETWAKLKYDYDSQVHASNVEILKGSKKKLKDGDELACTLCGHQYTNWDVMLCIAESGKQSG